jgi:hypothetical protein
MATVYERLEARVQRDEGGRGIRSILPSSPQLESGAKAVLAAERVAILTGFPCLLDCDPDFETDGPPGALAIAQILESLGKFVIILVDGSSYPAFRLLLDWFNATNGTHIGIRGFAPNSKDFRNVEADFVVSIERPGKAKDGGYYSMRGVPLTDVVCPLDQHFLAEGKPWGSFAIGDGGNEAGLGSLYDLIAQHIPNGPLIASTTAATNTLVASVSNWGGYAYSLAIALAADRPPFLSEAREIALAQKMQELGIRDGITKELGLTVDALPWETNAEVIRELLAIANSS